MFWTLVTVASILTLGVAAYMLGKAVGWNDCRQGLEEPLNDLYTMGYDNGYDKGFDEGCKGLSEAVQALKSYALTLIPTVSAHQKEESTSDTPT
jgi:hypothetical protein